MTNSASKAQTKTTEKTPEQQSFKEKAAAVAGFMKNWSWTFLLLTSVLIIGYYTLFPSRGYFHSDSTDTLMWAIASEDCGKLFNPDFDYACFLPFGTSLIMWALIPIFGIGMTTHVIGMLCFMLLFTGGLVFLLRQMGWSWQWVSVGVFAELMICSLSDKLREIFWGHTIYYSLGVFFIFVGLGLLFKQTALYEKRDATNEIEPRRKATRWIIICTVLIGVWFLLACMNQIIAVAIFALPVMAAVACERWLDAGTLPFSKKNLRALIVFVVMGVGMVLGYLLTALLTKEMHAGYETAFSLYSAMDTWQEHFAGFPTAWMALLGVKGVEGDKLLSVESVCGILSIITGMILWIVPVLALVFYRSMEDAKLRILTLTFWFMTLLIMLGYVIGRLSNANWRLSPIVAMAVVLTVAFAKWSLGKLQLGRLMSLLMIPVIAVSAISALRILKMPADNTEDSNLYAFAEALEEKNLTYGYATFWNANAVTIISDNKVRCRNITIDELGYRPYNYQGCRKWYMDQPGQDRYFLLLTSYEQQLLKDQNCPLVDKKTMEFSVNGYTIWVFNENIF